MQQKIFSVICAIAVLFAIAFSAQAIDFSAEEKYNSVFVVTSGYALGSGFAIGENCIITNAHVIENKSKITITTYSGESVNAYLVGCDEDKDIAVLCVDSVRFTPLKVADYNMLNIGDDVYAIGAPKSMAYTLTKGVISAKERKIGNYTYIQTDAAINEGNSGGPLMNQEGSVIGVNTLKMSDSEGIGLAIPMTVISEFVKSLNIQIDEDGNVTEIIAVDKKGENNNETANDFETKEEDEDKYVDYQPPSLMIVMLIVLGGSVALNIVLIIRLSSQNKPTQPRCDPSERTDFEIDILE